MYLRYYKPCSDMVQAFNEKFSEESLRANDATFSEYLDQRELSYENYSLVLKKLLTIEDITQTNAYTQLYQNNIIVSELKNQLKSCNESILYKIRFGKASVNPTDIIEAIFDELVLVSNESLRESPLPTPLFLAQLPHPHEHLNRGDQMCRHIGSIVKVKPTYVIFKTDKIPNNKLKKKWTVIFRSQRLPFRVMYNVLDVLLHCPVYRKYIFSIPNVSQPQVTASLAEISLINTTIAENPEQLQAVRHIVSGPSTLSPYIVWGPPGTGKTTTIVEAILQLYLLNKGRILVTAGSNAACDTIALQICEYIENDERFAKENKRQAVVRFFSSRRDVRSVHPLLLKYSKRSLEKKSKKSNQLKPDYSDIKLTNYRIVVVTLCMAGVLSYLGNGLLYSHVFIDEAAASTEPETLLGIIGIKHSACHIILSGDHKQLGPVVINKCAAMLGLGQSLMERLQLSKKYEVDAEGNYDCTLQSRLRRNYRSHPKILGLFNKLYYNDELIAMASPQNVNLAEHWSVLPNTKYPIIFHTVYGRTSHKPHSKSCYNDQEAKVLAWYIRTLLRKGIGNGIKPQAQDIGVITPYVEQCDRIEHFLRKQGHQAVEVCTVHRFQGREKPIIIASLVCSNASTTFVSKPQLVNVILSRARSLLILIGNPSTLSENKDFRFIIEQCKLNGNLVEYKK